MKCSIKSLLALMVGAVILESCNDSDFFETKSGAAKTGNMSFTATVDGADSRASFSGDSFSFMKPDSVISVFSSGENNKFTMNDEGIFTGNCEDNDEYCAVSPYSENNKVLFHECSCVYIIDWNGAEQTVDLNEIHAPMVAHVLNAGVGTQNVPLKFQNVCALIKFTTDYPCGSITLKSRHGEELAAKTLNVLCDRNCKLSTYITGTSSQTITLTGKDGGNIEAGTYYIPVIPREYCQGLDITFTNKYNEKTYTKSFTDGVDLACGEFLDLDTINIKSEMVHLAGKGTQEDPYLIHDFDQFMEMHDFVNNSTGGGDCYKLTDDIDCQGREMSPIGNFKHMFCGTFDGGNHCIKNLCINGQLRYDISGAVSSQYNRACALFAAIKGATIKNLTIDSPMLKPRLKHELMTVSPLVGVTYCADKNYDESRCKILNCKLTGNCAVIQESSRSNPEGYNTKYYGFIYGGFVGFNASNLEITDCSNNMNLTVSYVGELSTKTKCPVGGFVGLASAVSKHATVRGQSHDAVIRISNCRNNNQMTISTAAGLNSVNVGGFIGEVVDGYIYDPTCYFQNCVNNAAIGVSAEGVKELNLGGFVGNHDSDGARGLYPCFKNCINNGDLTVYHAASDTRIGGFSGINYNDDTKYINCVNTGNLTKAREIDPTPGAISYKHGTCTNCYDCSYYKLIEKEHGEMTNHPGIVSIDKVVKIMNDTELVWKNGFSRWRKKTVNGREILDLYTVKGPNIPQ